MSAVAANWQFLVPDAVEDVLLLPVADEHVDGARAVAREAGALAVALTRQHAGVVAPDLTGWAKDVAREPASALLRRLTGAVGPGGWLCVGFANRGNPARPMSTGSSSARAAHRLLESEGFRVLDVYVPFPDQTRPAYLVPAQRPAMSHFLRELFVPYVESGSALRGRVRQQLLRGMRAGALVAPDGLRAACAPATVLVARRTS